MIESLILEEENIFKDVKNLFRLKKLKKKADTTFKDIRNLFRPEKEKEEIKDRILRDIRNVFRIKKKIQQLNKYSNNQRLLLSVKNNIIECKEECYKGVGGGKSWSNNYIKYKSKGDTITLSVEEYINKQ